MFSPTITVMAGYHASQSANEEEQKRKRIEQLVELESKAHVFGGKLLKKSKHIGSWKERYIQITHNYIFSFKPGKEEGTHFTFPTEFIPIKTIQSVGRFIDEKEKKHVNLMHLYGADKDGILRNFYFDCESDSEREKWIARIKGQIEALKKPPAPAKQPIKQPNKPLPKEASKEGVKPKK